MTITRCTACGDDFIQKPRGRRAKYCCSFCKGLAKRRAARAARRPGFLPSTAVFDSRDGLGRWTVRP